MLLVCGWRAVGVLVVCCCCVSGVLMGSGRGAVVVSLASCRGAEDCLRLCVVVVEMVSC